MKLLPGLLSCIILLSMTSCGKKSPAPEAASFPAYVEPHRRPLLEYIQTHHDPESGARAVTDAALLQGHPIDVPDFMAICNITSEGITSADLIDSAQRAKLRMEPARLTWDQLLQENRPVILALPKNQYAVADPRDRQTTGGQTQLPIYYSTRAKSFLSEEELKIIWKGMAFYLTPPEREPAFAAAQITFDRLIHDFGELGPSREVSHRFKFKNTGAEPLEIFNVVKSCSCTSAKLSADIIPPGGEGAIDLYLDLRARDGEQRILIDVETNDPRAPALKLMMHGYAPPLPSSATLTQPAASH